jgi:hypothetical protein
MGGTETEREGDCVDIAFASGELFNFVEEGIIRRMPGDMVQELALECP